ncbi:acyl carrier protein [Streptomyces sp. NPDC002588]|uniref:acyl carrier protein n=1 Tax=Streptomyces sp. NPDC002588 TaxID=3154419 RepID=UPI0033204DEB
MSAESVVAEAVGQLLDLEPDDLTTSTRLGEAEGWDSVNQMRLLVHLERELGTALDYDRFMQAETLGDLASVVAAVARDVVA